MKQKFKLDAELPDFGLVRSNRRHAPTPQTAAVRESDAETSLEDAVADYLRAKAAMLDARRRVMEAVMEPGYVYGVKMRIGRKKQLALVDWSAGAAPKIRAVTPAAYAKAMGEEP